MPDYYYDYDSSDFEYDDQDAVDEAAHQADADAANDEHLIELWELSRPQMIIQNDGLIEPF